MNQYRWPTIGGYGMRRQNTVFALLVIIVCFPALAFDDGSLPTVSDTTAVALKNLTSSETTPTLPNATRTIYDTASPTVGTAQSPDYAPATSVSIDYSGMSDTVSGLKTVSLWVRANDGGWARTGQTLTTESGTFTFDPGGVEGAFYFGVLLEDNAGNVSPEPSGAGLTSSQTDGTPPVITLNGDPEMMLKVGEPFTDPGATATDTLEGDLTSRIEVSGTVDTSQAGLYTLRYNVADSAGNAATEATRTVTVEAVLSYALSIPTDLQGQAGATVPCAVNIAEAEAFSAYNITVSFDENVLEVASVTAGTSTESWGDPAVTNGAGSVSFAASGSALSAGSGSVAIIYATVKEGAEQDQTSPLSFASAEANGGEAHVTTDDGLFTVNNDTYLWGDVNGDGHVNNADSVLILKYRAGIVKKTLKSDDAEGDFEFFAAGDVSGDEPPIVGTVDASLIMRQNEGSISAFPCDVDGDGIGPELTPDKAAVKEAVLRDYGPPDAVTRLISIPGKLKLEPEATYEVPVSIDTANMIRGYYIEVQYDPRALEYLHTSKGSLTEEWLDPIVNPLTGKITIVGANADPLSGQGTLAVLTFRALSTVTRNAATRLKLEAAELNDALILSEKSTGVGEPVISALEPNTGAETGGTIVRITGANLGDVSRVLFGGAESPWVRIDATGSAVLAVTPPGGGTADVTVESPAGAYTLPEGFTFFLPQVHLTMTPEETAVSGTMFDVPVWLVDLSDGQASTLAFDLCFEPTVLTPKKIDGAFVTLGDSALQANKAVTATMTAPGRLHVTVDGAGTGSLESGLLVTCHLLAIASEEEPAGLIYITDTEAKDAQEKALPTSASLVSK
ncbi:MAG: DUF5011 domain-containing protein [Candidatus Hydrogenedentota bacterium]